MLLSRIGRLATISAGIFITLIAVAIVTVLVLLLSYVGNIAYSEPASQGSLMVIHQYSNTVSSFEVGPVIRLDPGQIAVTTVSDSPEITTVKITLPISLDLSEADKEALDAFFLDRGLQYQGFTVQRIPGGISGMEIEQRRSPVEAPQGQIQ